jgi:hypothetical protein
MVTFVIKYMSISLLYKRVGAGRVTPKVSYILHITVLANNIFLSCTLPNLDQGCSVAQFVVRWACCRAGLSSILDLG